MSERHTKSNTACLPDTTIRKPKPEGNDSAVALGYDIRCLSDILSILPLLLRARP
ncbi:MAG: hypothetical protein K2K00_02420 [Muribaculaceae bacterium]|nr:hypothetical protein [Muribaculaceae bacterium]